MQRHGWNAEHRDALLARVTVLTAGTAVVGAVGAVALGAGLAVASPVAKTKATQRPSTQPRTSPAGSSSTAAGSGQGSVALSPQDVQVAVLNGTGIAGTAHAAAGDLRKAGFQIAAISNYQGRVGASIIGYPAGMRAAAELLSSRTGVTQISQADTGGPLVLVVGPDWQGSQPVVQAPQSNGGGGFSGGGGNAGAPVPSGGS